MDELQVESLPVNHSPDKKLLPNQENMKKYISMVREIQGAFNTYDVHTHPVEIILDLHEYQEDPEFEGVFALGKGKYVSPSLAEVNPNKFGTEKNYSKNEYRRILPMFLKKTYFHTGPKVFRDYFDMVGIDKALLLPVAHPLGSVNRQIAVSYKMFKNDPRFRMAGTIHNTIGNDQIESFLRMQIENYYIAGVKIHPNVSEIDLGTSEGKKRVERIIGASDRFNLPVIIHGGRNNILDNDRSRFAELSNFQDIDLRSSTPVVIAHGGAYGLRASEVSDEIVPVLKKLLSKYDNLYIDVAGLSDDIILLFLSFIGTDRILFGSDALYENQAVMGMRLLFALERSHLNVEDSLIRILSSNAARIIFREGPNKQKVAKAESIEDQKQELDL